MLIDYAYGPRRHEKEKNPMTENGKRDRHRSPQLGVPLPGDMMPQLREVAARNGNVAMGGLVRGWIAERLAEEGFQPESLPNPRRVKVKEPA